MQLPHDKDNNKKRIHEQLIKTVHHSTADKLPIATVAGDSERPRKRTRLPTKLNA
jgi:hypothetical protein